MLVVVGLLLLWLNGPGLRWLGPKVGGHYLEKAGFDGGFRLEGSAWGGLRVVDLELTAAEGPLERLTVRRVELDYEPTRVIRGEVRAVRVLGLHADLRLEAKEDDPTREPADPEEIIRQLKDLRPQVVAVEMDLSEISARLRREEEEVFVLEPSSLSHAAGSGVFRLNLGAIRAIGGTELAAAESVLTWEPNALRLDRLDPYPGVGLRNLVVDLPDAGWPDLSTGLLLDEGSFELRTHGGLTGLVLEMLEGRVDLAATAGRFGVELPAAGVLSGLRVELDGIQPDPLAATGRAGLVLEAMAWEEWQAERLSADLDLGAENAALDLNLAALGAELALEASAPLDRGGERWSVGEIAGTFDFNGLASAWREAAARLEALPDDLELPEANLAGTFGVAADEDFQAQSAELEFALRPQDEIYAALAGEATWQVEGLAELILDLPGLELVAAFDPEAMTYQGSADFIGFQSERFLPWLEVAGIEFEDRATLDGRWEGSGDLELAEHRGELRIEQATYEREESPTLEVLAELAYDWPRSVDVHALRANAAEQTLELSGGLSEGWVTLERFLWTDAGVEMAEGRARLPLPENLTDWEAILADETRPMELDLETRVLPLSMLAEWVPQAAEIDPAATARLEARLRGTYGDPEIDLEIEALNLGMAGNDELPPADLTLRLRAADGEAGLSGSLLARDFDPAVIAARMPFRPVEWLNEPDAVMDEEIQALLTLPRIDLARFRAMVPGVSSLSGMLDGQITVGGSAREPVLDGRVELSGGALAFEDDDLPSLTGLAATVELALDRVTLRELRGTVAGGSLRAAGGVTIEDGALGEIDLQLQAEHLPLVRNELMIVRANANLSLRGPWESATLSGTVGIVDSLFFRDIELLPIGTPFTAPSAAELPKVDAPQNLEGIVPEPFASWGLNVTVRTEDPFLIRGNLATGEIGVALRIGGTVAFPAPDGSVTLSDLRAALPFSRLTVRRGTLIFTPATGFDPILEIRGASEPRPYRVDIYVYGRASDPQLVLTSNPPLPENEIMTLLATGTTTSGLEDPQAASSRALQLLVEEVRRGRVRFGRQLRPLLGLLDRVDFSLAEADPYSSDAFSTATVSLTDRWFVSAGLGDEGNTRVMALWRFSFR